MPRGEGAAAVEGVAWSGVVWGGNEYFCELCRAVVYAGRFLVPGATGIVHWVGGGVPTVFLIKVAGSWRCVEIRMLKKLRMTEHLPRRTAARLDSSIIVVLCTDEEQFKTFYTVSSYPSICSIFYDRKKKNVFFPTRSFFLRVLSQKKLEGNF